MGAASDTTNSMAGEHNSVKSRFLILNSNIFYSHCHIQQLLLPHMRVQNYQKPQTFIVDIHITKRTYVGLG